MTVGDLARRLRCSRRTLYALAPSKQALFLAVLDRLLLRIERLGREAAHRTADPRDRITAFLEPGLSELRTGTPALFEDIAGFPPARRRLDAHQASRREQLRALVDDGVASGAYRPVNAMLAAQLMVAAYRAVTDPEFLCTVDATLPEAVRQGEHLLLHGLLHPPGTT